MFGVDVPKKNGQEVASQQTAILFLLFTSR
jgi:hypothetical protein